MVERPAVRAESEAIGDEEAAHHRRALVVRRRSGRGCRWGAPASGGSCMLPTQKRPCAVAATVIQPVVGQMRLRGAPAALSASFVEVEAVEAGL